jgi:hypothetical protein
MMTDYPEHATVAWTNTPRLGLVLTAPRQPEPGSWHGVLVDCTNIENEPGGPEAAHDAKALAEGVAATEYGAFGGYWLLTTFGKIMWVDSTGATRRA